MKRDFGREEKTVPLLPSWDMKIKNFPDLNEKRLKESFRKIYWKQTSKISLKALIRAFSSINWLRIAR